MSGPAFLVTSPLTSRLLRRILILGLVFVLSLACVRAWWEYRNVLRTTEELMTSVEDTMARSLANSLWDFNTEQLSLLLEGIRNSRSINYAAVREHDRLLAENGVRKSEDVLERETLLTRSHEGRTVPLGTLVLQADLARVRQQAFDAALVALAFSTGMTLLISLVIFLLVRDMISRHLASAARHFQYQEVSPDNLRLPELRLQKKWAGDELDILCLAVNHMQENLARTYAQAWAAEQEAKSQARFPEENPNPVLRIGGDGVVRIANPASMALLAHLGSGLGLHLPDAYAGIIREALATGLMQQFETEFNGRTFALVARPIQPDGYVNIYGMDITERVHAEKEIRQNMSRLQCLVRVLQNSSESVQEFLDFCLAESLVLTDSRFGYIYHYNEERGEFVLNSWSSGVMPECNVQGASMVYALDETGIWGEVVRQRKPLIVNDFQAPHACRRGYPDGHVALTNFMSVPVFQGGRLVAVAGVANRDEDYQDTDVMQLSLLMDACWHVVGRMDAEKNVLRSLHEKEILLKEIHHRVKNNLQIISSLLFLQMEYVFDDRDKELFAESQKRIQAMALVHEELYGAMDLSSVDMREYIPRLVERVLAGAGIPVSAEYLVEEVRLPVTRSIPCGLALNELVMNTVKHAFRPGPGSPAQGRLRVCLRREAHRLVLEVEDNGPGLPQGFNIEDTPTLGMTLVASLTQQLGGHVQAIGKNPGALFRLNFPGEGA